MANLQHTVATLRVIGDGLDFAEITGLLGCEPSITQKKGDQHVTQAGTVITKRHTMWRLNATTRGPGDFEAQVDELLNKLTGNLQVWNELAQRFKIDLFCGWFMETSNDGVAISPKTLTALGERQIELILDIYDP